LKTFGFAHHGAAISSRIREVREKLYWFLFQRGTLQLGVFGGLGKYEIALVNPGLGEKDEAFAWLEKAYGVRDKGPDVHFKSTSYRLAIRVALNCREKLERH
jgi:hypothetical protein